MSDNVKHTVFLEIGAGVNESQFNKVVSVLDEVNKKVGAGTEKIRVSAEKGGRALEAAIPQKKLEKLRDLIQSTFSSASGQPFGAANLGPLKKAFEDVLGISKALKREVQEIVAATSKDFFAKDAEVYPLSVGKAITAYRSSYAGIDKRDIPVGAEKAANMQIGSFIGSLTATGSRLRSFNADRYKGWEGTQDFDKLQAAFNSGLLKMTKDGFKATKLDPNAAASVLGVSGADKTNFFRFSGLKDFNVLKENLDKEIELLTKRVGDKFRVSFNDMARSFGKDISQTDKWYPKLQQAGRFLSRAETGSLQKAPKDALGKVSPFQLAKGLYDKDLQITGNHLKILTAEGLKAVKMTEEFARANGFLSKSFAENNKIKKLADETGYSVEKIRASMKAVRDEFTKESAKTEIPFKTLAKDADFAALAIERLKNKAVAYHKAQALKDTIGNRSKADAIKSITENFGGTLDEATIRGAVRQAQKRLSSAIVAEEDRLTKSGLSRGEVISNLQNFTRGLNLQDEALKNLGVSGTKFGGVLTSLGAKFKTLAEYSLAGSFIYGIQGAVVNAVQSIVQFDQSLHDLKAITEATDTEMELFGLKILDLASNTRFSVTEISEGMKILGQAGFTASETLQAMDAIVNLTAGTMSQLSTIVDLTTTAIGAFDMKASEATEVADVFAAAINKSKLDTEKLKVAFNYVGPVAHDAGVSLQDLAAMMSLLSNAGIRASTIGTSLRQIFDKLLNPTEEFTAAIKAAGYEIGNFDPRKNKMADVLQRIRDVAPDAEAALKYFGVRGASSVAVLAGTSKKDFEAMEAAMGRTGTAARMASEQMLGLESVAKQSVSRINVLWLRLADITAKPILETVMNGFNSFLGTLVNLNEPFASIVGFFGKMAFSVASVSVALGVLSAATKGGLVTGFVAANAQLAAFIGLTYTAATAEGAAATATFAWSTSLAALKGALLAAGTLLKGLVGTVGGFLGAATIAGTAIYAIGDSLGWWNSKMENLNEELKNNEVSWKNEEKQITATKSAFDELSGVVRDSTKPLDDRKEAVAKLISMGVKLDTSMVDNKTNVENFNTALVNGIPVLDAYAKKLDQSILKINQARGALLQKRADEAKIQKEEALKRLGDGPQIDQYTGAITDTRAEDLKIVEDAQQVIEERNQFFQGRVTETIKLQTGFRTTLQDLTKSVVDGEKSQSEAVKKLSEALKATGQFDSLSDSDFQNLLSQSGYFSESQIDGIRKSRDLKEIEGYTKKNEELFKVKHSTHTKALEDLSTVVKNQLEIMSALDRQFTEETDRIQKDAELTPDEKAAKVKEAKDKYKKTKEHFTQEYVQGVGKMTSNIQGAVELQTKTLESEFEAKRLSLEIAMASTDSLTKKAEIAVKIEALEKELASKKEAIAKNFYESLDKIPESERTKLSEILGGIELEAKTGALKAELERVKLEKKLSGKSATERKKIIKDQAEDLKDQYERDVSSVKIDQQNKFLQIEEEFLGREGMIDAKKYEAKKEAINREIILLQEYIAEKSILAAKDKDIKLTDDLKKLDNLKSDRAENEAAERIRIKGKETAANDPVIGKIAERERQTEILRMERAGRDTALTELQNAKDRELDAIAKFYEGKAELEDEKEKESAAIKEFYAERKAQIEERLANENLQRQASFYGGMSDLMGQFYEATGERYKAFFVFQRALRVAEIIMNTIAEAAAIGPEAPGVFGLSQKTLILAKGYAQAGLVAGQSIADLKLASGGRVKGYSPHSRADNIRAWLTAGEYVHSVPAVKYYGEGAMEAINNRSVPREVLSGFSKSSVTSGSSNFASGGLVENNSSNSKSNNITVNIHGGDEEAVKRYLPQLENAIKRAVGDDIRNDGDLRKTIIRYAR